MLSIVRNLLAFLLLSASIAFAQGTHTATISGCVDTTPNVTFNLYQGTASGGESSAPVNATPSATCNFSVTGLLGLTKYYWYVKAVCSTCNPSLSAPSNEVSGTTLADAAPAAPTGLGATNISKNSVPLHWNAPPVQNGWTPVAYEVVRGINPTLPAPSTIAELPITITSYTDGGCAKTCYYAVKSYAIQGTDNGFHLSRMSNIVEAIMPAGLNASTQ